MGARVAHLHPALVCTVAVLIAGFFQAAQRGGDANSLGTTVTDGLGDSVRMSRAGLPPAALRVVLFNVRRFKSHAGKARTPAEHRTLAGHRIQGHTHARARAHTHTHMHTCTHAVHPHMNISRPPTRMHTSPPPHTHTQALQLQARLLLCSTRSSAMWSA